MSKHINTHLFFHMGDGGAKQKNSSSGDAAPRKPKKPSSSLIAGYEIDTNPPIVPESGDYYDYYTNYGIPEYFGPTSPTSPQYATQFGAEAEQDQYYHDYRNSDYYDYQASNADLYTGGYQNNVDYDATFYVGHSSAQQAPGYASTNNGHQRTTLPAGASPYHGRHALAGQPGPSFNSYLHPSQMSSSSNATRAPPASPHFSNDLAYRYDQHGLTALAHRLHRITFVEACIFQPPDLGSPSMARAPNLAGQGPSAPNAGAGSAAGPPMRPVMAMHGSGERSPTGGTGSTQYYQEWASKHMRHLCSRFERPTQQHLLMNVERKSKFPFIILCTPQHRTSTLSKSSSSTSSSRMSRTYQREISQHSAYSMDNADDEDVDEEALAATEEARWLTQKQRDGYHAILPPPPPPLPMPHIWPELRYIDGLYTVCDSIVRPGSGVYDADGDDSPLFLGGGEQDASNHSSYSDQYQQHQGFDNSIYGTNHQTHSHQSHHSHQQDKTQPHVTFAKSEKPRPAGYIVSAFATFPGEDSERLEKNWQTWTGAQILYNRLPMYIGLRRLIFLKRCPDDINAQSNKAKQTVFTGFTYVLLCECYSLKETNIASVCTTIDNLRARCCGYSALYLTHYQQAQQAPPSRGHQYTQQMSAPAANHYPATSSQQHHHSHHYVPRHHRSTSDFTTEFDVE